MFFGGISGSSVGTTLFVGCAIGKISIEHAARHLWPFWLAMLVVLLLVTHIPALALWVPSLRYAGITFRIQGERPCKECGIGGPEGSSGNPGVPP